MLDVISTTTPTMLWCGILVLSTAAYLIGDAVYNLLFSPLASIPGPKLWAISRIPSQLSVLRGRNHIDIGALHAQYGPTVRIGPNEVTFSTAQAFRDIYLLRPGGRLFTKPRSHSPLPINGVDNMASAVDEGIHARQKKVFSAAFAPRALKEQESLIQGYVNMMTEKLKGEIQQSPTQDGITKVDICKWINYTTFDILGDLIFGESFGCLEDGTLHPWIALMFGSARDVVIMIIINQFPILGWFVRLLMPRSLRQKERDHFNLAVEKVERRLQLGTDRPDFVSTILKYGLSDVKDGKTLDRDKLTITRAELDSNAFLFIIAGSETSATFLSGCMYYLCMNHRVLQLLVQEIRTHFTNDADITFDNTPKLPYLAVVMQESFRMYPPFATALARTPPTGGEIVDGYFIPEKTIVSCHHYASYHSAANFALSDEFIPERWLQSDERFKSDKKDTLNPFSLGPLGCSGKNLAYAEIRLILCKLLFHFDFELCDESANWADRQEVYFLWRKIPLMVKIKQRSLIGR